MKVHSPTSFSSDQSGSALTIKNLPNELILHFLAFFEIKDFKNLSHVCRKWKNLLENDVNWKLRKLIYIYSQSLIEIFENQFEQLPIHTLSKKEKIAGFGTLLKLDKIKAPIMRIHNTTAIIFRYINQAANKNLGLKSTTPTFEVIWRLKNKNYQHEWQSAWIFFSKLEKWFSKGHLLPTVINDFPGDKMKFEYIKRLFNKQPCGIYDWKAKSEIQLFTDGKSTVYLV